MLFWLVLVDGCLVLSSLDLVLPSPSPSTTSRVCTNCGSHLLVDNSAVASCSKGLRQLHESAMNLRLVSSSFFLVLWCSDGYCAVASIRSFLVARCSSSSSATTSRRLYTIDASGHSGERYLVNTTWILILSWFSSVL